MPQGLSEEFSVGEKAIFKPHKDNSRFLCKVTNGDAESEKIAKKIVKLKIVLEKSVELDYNRHRK